jgi:hypothetical protein
MTKAACFLLAWTLGGCFVPVREVGRAGDRDEGPALTLTLPFVLPPLVVIRPGVSVFLDLDDEVFFFDGYYWAREDAQWYQAREPHGSWSRVDRAHVAPELAQFPPGRYRHWRGEVEGRNDREEGRRFGLDVSRD